MNGASRERLADDDYDYGEDEETQLDRIESAVDDLKDRGVPYVRVALVAASVSLAVSVIAGCATPHVGQSPYRPNVGGDGHGYSEVQLNESTIQITFVGTTATDAQAGAMRRAADTALWRGADGFVITNREDSFDQVVKKRLIIGRVRRDRPFTRLTIVLLRRGDFATAYPGTMVYDAHLVAAGYAPTTY